jgi:hypothetical protein
MIGAADDWPAQGTVVFAGPIEFEPKLRVKTHRADILRLASRS